MSKTSRGGGLCAVSLGGIDQFKNLCGRGLKFVFKFELIILKIGGHVLAEGSWLSVPAPRRVQIFFQVWCEGGGCYNIFILLLFSCFGAIRSFLNNKKNT